MKGILSQKVLRQDAFYFLTAHRILVCGLIYLWNITSSIIIFNFQKYIILMSEISSFEDSWFVRIFVMEFQFTYIRWAYKLAKYPKVYLYKFNQLISLAVEYFLLILFSIWRVYFILIC